MRILVHDYAGHPFQVQLSRALAERRPGDSVHHQYSAEFVSGKGDLELRQSDPPNLSISCLSTGRKFNRYRPGSRLRHEWLYARAARRHLRRWQPDVAVYSNVPLLAHFLILLGARRTTSIFWHQDVYSAAIGDAARRRLGPLLGGTLAWLSDAMERWVAARSRVIVPIADSFREVYERWRVPAEKVVLQPNWAPVEDLPLQVKENEWADRHGLTTGLTIMYSGTLGLKHRPQALAHLATYVGQRPGGDRVVVISEGRGRRFLDSEIAAVPVGSLVLLDFQPFSELPAVLGAADVFVALLEPDASRYSVPSKILSYMCAGRPIVALVPEENQAAATVLEARCGFVVSSESELTVRVGELLTNETLRLEQGRNARQYAETVFNIDRIAAKWAVIIDNANGPSSGPAGKG